jgi:hypothetical protein
MHPLGGVGVLAFIAISFWLEHRPPKSPIFGRSLPVCAFLQRPPLAFHLGRYLPEYLGHLHGWVASLQAAGRILEPAGEVGKE